MKLMAVLLCVSGLAGVDVGKQGGLERWTSQLEALDPANPLAYFELAEVIVDSAPEDRAALALARHLFGTAGQLDRVRLGASAALALAAVAPREEDAMRLRAVALMLDPMRGVGREAVGDGVVDGESAVDISKAFGGFRTGRGQGLRRVLGDPELRARLEPFDVMLGGLAWLEEVSGRVRTRPDLDEEELVRMLRVEVRFLEGKRPRWSSEVLIDGGGRLLEVARDEVGEVLGGDPQRPFYENGEWRP